MSATHNSPDELQGLRALKAELEQLPKAVEPERDLWHGIEQRIAHKPRHARSRVFELAVAAGVAAVVSSAIFLGFGDQGTAPQTAVPVFAYEQLDAAYQPLRKASLARYSAQAESLDPAVRDIVAKNLTIIDQALAEIRTALKERPNDPALNQLLQRTYEQEMAILAAVTTPQSI